MADSINNQMDEIKEFVQQHQEAFLLLKYAKKIGISKIDSFHLLMNTLDKIVNFISLTMNLTPIQKIELKEKYKVELLKLSDPNNIDNMGGTMIMITISLISIVFKMKIKRNECDSTVS